MSSFAQRALTVTELLLQIIACVGVTPKSLAIFARVNLFWHDLVIRRLWRGSWSTVRTEDDSWRTPTLGTLMGVHYSRAERYVDSVRVPHAESCPDDALAVEALKATDVWQNARYPLLYLAIYPAVQVPEPQMARLFHPDLRVLYLEGGNITNAILEALKAMFPLGCRVTCDLTSSRGTALN